MGVAPSTEIEEEPLVREPQVTYPGTPRTTQTQLAERGNYFTQNEDWNDLFVWNSNPFGGGDWQKISITAQQYPSSVADAYKYLQIYLKDTIGNVHPAWYCAAPKQPNQYGSGWNNQYNYGPPYYNPWPNNIPYPWPLNPVYLAVLCLTDLSHLFHRSIYIRGFAWKFRFVWGIEGLPICKHLVRRKYCGPLRARRGVYSHMNGVIEFWIRVGI
jgi:hypothetical protein